MDQPAPSIKTRIEKEVLDLVAIQIIKHL